MDAGDWLWVWIGAAVIFAVAELVTPFLFFMVSFAAGAALAAVVAALDGSVGLQWAVFIARQHRRARGARPDRAADRRAPSADDDQQGATRWVGRTAVVLQDIPGGGHDSGLVRLERAEWRAETDADARDRGRGTGGGRLRARHAARRRADRSRPVTRRSAWR